MALKLAGERALRIDVEAAERLFTRAVELSAPGDAGRPDLLLSWARSLQQRGRYEEAGSACEEAAQGFLDQGRKGSAAKALAGLDRSLRSLGRQEGSKALDEALALTADEPEGEAAAIVMQALAVAAMNRGDYAEGDLLIARAADNYARLGMEVPIYVQGWKAQADLVLGRPGAIDRLLSVTRDSRDAGTGYEAAITHLNASISLFPFMGAAAFDLAEEGLEIARTRGVRDIEGTLEVIRAWGMVTVGRWSEALAAFDESHDLVREDPFSLVQWLEARAEVLNAMGRNAEALELAERACELAGHWDFMVRDATARSVLVLALVMAGRRQEAVQVLTELASVASHAQNIQEYLPALMRCALRCGEVGLAEQLVTVSGWASHWSTTLSRRAKRSSLRRAASTMRRRQASPTPPPAGASSASPTRRRTRCSARGAAWWRSAERRRRQRRSPRLARSSLGSAPSRRSRRRMSSHSRPRPPSAGVGLLAREHQPRDQRRRLLLHRRDGVRVGVERDRDGGVPEAL